MPDGYCGKILYADLTTKTKTVEEPGEDFYRKFIGGWGIVAHELLKRAPKGVDPLAPENPLIFATGLATGSPTPSGARHSVGAKSPLTGGFGQADLTSYWGPELKRAGFDAVVITGASPTPVYLWIHDGSVEIRDAGHLWGLETGPAQTAIRGELGDEKVRVAQIGPAGENLVRISTVMHDVDRWAGRGGLGAVMGSKKLKAIAVRGTGAIPVADMEPLIALRDTHIAARDNWKHQQLHGTGGGVAEENAAGGIPTRNFRGGVFEGWEKISGERITDEFLVGRDTCGVCMVGCKRRVRAEGRFAVDPIYGGPEFEVLVGFGTQCGIGDLEALLYVSQRCNAYGLDPTSTGMTVAWLMDCFEEDLITAEQTGGIEARFGDAEAMLKLVEKIARREGIGDTLAEGSLRASRTFGRQAEARVVHVKGQEMLVPDARTQFGMALNYAVSPFGPDYVHAAHDNWVANTPNWLLKDAFGFFRESLPHDEASPEKVSWLAFVNPELVLFNCLGWCFLYNYSMRRVRDVTQALTGWRIREKPLVRAGERALTMARAFNLREGLTVADDVLPPRMSAEPLHAADYDGWTIDPKQLAEARSLYYGMMGWDEETGVPKAWKLHELDIGWVLDELPD